MVAAILYVWAFVAQFLLPVPGLGTAGGVLQYVAAYRSSFVLSYALFTAANSLSIVGVIAIYVVTKPLNRSYAMLGGVTMVIGLVAALFSNTAPALIKLSEAYSAATSDAERQALATAAGTVSAMNNPLVASAFIGVGVIFVSLAMLKRPFGKGLAFNGLAVGTLNIVRAIPSLSGSVPVAILFLAVSSVWIFGVGYRVFGLAQARAAA